ncbi:DMT family transporter [Afifella sp. H1R]|uniref:DMT family transporter n=1 Tax=Afifella sp. H1R TaxID=2908841 RepID=UPI001F297F71|nr:DMT family transporter [Afifella sp. H1R]
MTTATRAIILKVSSTIAFALMLSCIKLVGERVPTGEIVFFRSAFALVPLLGMLAWQNKLKEAVRTKDPWSHARRGLIGVTTMMLWFAGVQRLPLPESMAISYGAPLMIVVLGALILHETVRIYRSTAVAVGFVGIMIVLWPRFDLLSSGELGGREFVGSLCALGSMVLTAVVAILIRKMTATESTSAIVFYFSVTCTVVALFTIPFGWVMPDTEELILLTLCGLFGGLGQISLTAAYRYAETSTIAPFEYASMIWGTIAGYLLFNEIPGINVAVGGAVVIAAGIFIIYREHQLGLERRKMRKLSTPQG